MHYIQNVDIFPKVKKNDFFTFILVYNYKKTLNTMEDTLFNIGKSKLNPFQLNVLNECIEKKNGGLSLALGSGKTLISIVLALRLVKEKRPVLVVVSKTLIESWINEIHKFFDKQLKYIVFHKEYIKDINNFSLNSDVNVVITTPEVLSKSYKDENIKEKFIVSDIINEGRFNEHKITRYKFPSLPFSTKNKGYGLVHSILWGCLIVDEVQKYTQIKSAKCQSIGSISSDFRWVLSGTMFNEPIPERILGYYIILNDPYFPRTLPATIKFLKSSFFKGFRDTLVMRKTNPSFKEPKINKQIISHNMTIEEQTIYLSMKNIIKVISNKIRMSKVDGNVRQQRKFSSYLLAMITYLRQSIVCSLLPISNVILDMMDFQNKSELSQIINDNIQKLNLNEWMNSKNAAKSSRITKGIEIVNNHEKENVVIFFSFRTCLDLFHSFLEKNRLVYTITGSMNSSKRMSVLEEFKKPNENGLGNILLLTYDIGSEGLNIQCSNTVLLMDFQWNHGKSQQAIGRVLRYGQTATDVNIYLFTSNTALEQGILEKQYSKLEILKDLLVGQQQTSIAKLSIKDILRIIMKDDNTNIIKKLHHL
jgi:SNF2 family DNA or RNA helicase